jgi:transcription initiation factor TFIIB
MQNSIACSTCEAENRIITDLDTGGMICSQCGLVLFDKIQDTKQEWREFPDTEALKNRKRTGAPTSLAHHDMGLYTMIGRGDKDARGKVLDSSACTSMRRLRIWDLRSQASGKENLRPA